MPDAVFEHPRLVSVYDALDADRGDLEVYAAIVAELGARGVLDVGCGTGVLAVLLAEQGLEVTGVDPAAGSIEFARVRRGAERVRWIHGDATTLPPMQVDLATMTGNAAQAIVEPSAWHDTLDGVYAALRPGGHFVLETRDPSRRAWESWTHAASARTTAIEHVGVVDTWAEVVEVRLPLVRFRQSWVFASDGATLTSDSTLRFREREEVARDLVAHGFTVDEVRDAPDRPGLELVFLASRPARA